MCREESSRQSGFCLNNKTYLIGTSWSSDLGSWYPNIRSCVGHTINCSWLCPHDGGRVNSSSSSRNFWSPPARNTARLHWENLYIESHDLCCGHDCFKPMSFSRLNWFFLFLEKKPASWCWGCTTINAKAQHTLNCFVQPNNKLLTVKLCFDCHFACNFCIKISCIAQTLG